MGAAPTGPPIIIMGPTVSQSVYLPTSNNVVVQASCTFCVSSHSFCILSAVASRSRCIACSAASASVSMRLRLISCFLVVTGSTAC